MIIHEKHIALTIIIGVALGVGGFFLLWPYYSSHQSHSSQPTVAPAVTPDPRVLAAIAAGPGPILTPEAPEEWIRSVLVDSSKPPTPDNLFVISSAEPVITKNGAVWQITFK